MSMPTRMQGWPRERLAERVSAASYGSVLVLAALALIDGDDVGAGWGWELVTGVGVATWIAHLYAEVVGEHLRHATAAHNRTEIGRAMADGSPILLATVLPGIMLLLVGSTSLTVARRSGLRSSWRSCSSSASEHSWGGSCPLATRSPGSTPRSRPCSDSGSSA